MLPASSAAIPSGRVPGMKWCSEPSFALPIRMPTCQPGLRGERPPPSGAIGGPGIGEPDSESATISVSSARIVMPLGRPKCRHSSTKFRSSSRIWTRLFERSATNSRPCESNASACAPRNSPGPSPSRPTARTNSPSVVISTSRSPSCWAVEGRGQCPSATMMLPFGASAQAVGPMKVFSPAADTPACPRLISRSPSWLNLWSWKPRPAVEGSSPNGPLSPAHRLPSPSMQNPWAWTIIPSPKLFGIFEGGRIG